MGAMMVEIVGALREDRSNGSRFGPVESGQCGECWVRVETMDKRVHCCTGSTRCTSKTDATADPLTSWVLRWTRGEGSTSRRGQALLHLIVQSCSNHCARLVTTRSKWPGDGDYGTGVLAVELCWRRQVKTDQGTAPWVLINVATPMKLVILVGPGITRSDNGLGVPSRCGPGLQIIVVSHLGSSEGHDVVRTSWCPIQPTRLDGAVPAQAACEPSIGRLRRSAWIPRALDLR